ncbi:hypothetical protein Scep_008510 [Stephania cephalantha]|uniref:F-box domain-containing protein n=1 Tax=Stephania cephalantha TaxID=152367 RepID=A0AAP0PM54_9MAGN
MIGSRSAAAAAGAIGLCLLPSELIHEILLRLPLPELLRLKSVSKALSAVISADDFRRECNSRSLSDTWLFVYKKRSPRDSGLHGFSDRSGRWFKISSVAGLLAPGEDLFLLAASGDFFLFASNNRGDLIAFNLPLRTAKKLPHSPLGPRGTSSWRRSGLKLISGPAGSDRFRFLFAELHENRPVLLEYFSESDSWRCVEARDTQPSRTRGVFLSVVHGRNDSVLLAATDDDDEPVIVRPRFNAAAMDDLAIGFSTGGRIKRLHVFGDGYVVVVRSESVSGCGGSEKERVMTWIEVQGVSVDGRSWELVSSAPSGLIPKKAYVAMTGCIEERDGVVRVVLMMSNWEGLWEIVWLSFDLVMKVWKWVPLPECWMKGSNMAGMTLSSGLTLR